jgi:hypothetical protein
VVIGPFQHHDKSAAWQFSFNHFQRLNINLRFILGVQRVKMRRVVLAADVHMNEYSEELANGWHD